MSDISARIATRFLQIEQKKDAMPETSNQWTLVCQQQHHIQGPQVVEGAPTMTFKKLAQYPS